MAALSFPVHNSACLQFIPNFYLFLTKIKKDENILFQLTSTWPFFHIVISLPNRDIIMFSGVFT